MSLLPLHSAADSTEPLVKSPSIFACDKRPVVQSKIDELIFARLARAGIEPANLSSDACFLRRVYLDVIGTLPTAEEARIFLGKTNADKREELIEQLLGRPEFADYWAMHWSDLLRIKAEFPINLWPVAAQEYFRWLRESLREDKPYDQFVQELLTANGSNFRVGSVNFFRALQRRDPESLAQAIALAFLGIRSTSWSDDTWREMAVFVSQIDYKTTGEWKEEIVFYNPDKPLPKHEVHLPDGRRVVLQSGNDPRIALAEWITSSKNPWFAKAVVNRIWAWLLGAGIVQEPDDFRNDNPPSHPDVLAFLEKELVTSRYQLKHIYRLILNSSTYQLSCIPHSNDPQGERLFASYRVRRLEAEVLADAICQVTGSSEQYSSAVPEPYTIMPEGQRAIALPDGSISSASLELFGRPARDTGLASERNNHLSASQRLYLLNSSHIERKLEQGVAMQEFFRSAPGSPATIRNLYITILSRYPEGAEVREIKDYAQANGIGPGQSLLDAAWALLNSSEFLYRH